MTRDEMAELKSDMEYEAKQEMYQEMLMRDDEFYCIEQFSEEIMAADDILKEVSNRVKEYGHNITQSELLGYV